MSTQSYQPWALTSVALYISAFPKGQLFKSTHNQNSFKSHKKQKHHHTCHNIQRKCHGSYRTLDWKKA